jgi:hypothetical protein
LAALAGQVRKRSASRPEIEIVPFDYPGVDLLVILCGCLRACADKDEVRAAAERHIVIAGQSLAGTPQNEDRLAALLAAEIDLLLPGPGD